MTEPELEVLRQQLIEKLRPSGWVAKLKAFLYSSEFRDIISTLAAQEGKKFTPAAKHIFRAFELCPYDQLKLVILGQDPYYSMYGTKTVADGLAFSCSNTEAAQPSLTQILTAVNRTVYPNEPYSYDQDLSRWAKQGVLLLNTALTTNVGESGSHYKLWAPFTAYVLDTLDKDFTGLPFWFIGNEAQKKGCLINERVHYKFRTEHPAAAVRGHREWKDEDTFNAINEILKKTNNTKIIW